MKKYSSALVTKLSVIMLLPLFTYAQSPDWVENYGKSNRYPASFYLTGFGLAQMGKDLNLSECKQMATDDAKSVLIQSIRVKIRSEVTSNVKVINARVSEYFSSVTQSTSSIEITGLEIEHYKSKDACYSLAFVNKEKLTSIYSKKASVLRETIGGHLQNAMRYEDAGRKTEALNEYLLCYPLFRMLEEVQSIVVVSRSASARAFSDLDKEISSDNVNIRQLNEAVQKLIQRPLKTPDDLAWYLVYSINKQLDKNDENLLVVPFSYQDTKMGSPFSRYFKELMESKITELTDLNVVQLMTVVNPKTRNIAQEFVAASGAAQVMTGTYWEQPEGIKFLIIVRRVSDSQIIASSEALISYQALETANLDIKPQNFKDALSDQNIFNKDEVIGGGINLEVWTDKGIDNVLYTEGEQMKAYVRVNMPSYIRFIYHLADGKRTLLLDNYYIDESKVNMVYQIPEEFVCSAPFGAEFLQAFARTRRFEPLSTSDVDGYEIIDEKLKEFVPRMRGFKKLKMEVQQAEKIVVVTTLNE